jgi:membrane-associated phospholipid phosphatase
MRHYTRSLTLAASLALGLSIAPVPVEAQVLSPQPFGGSVAQPAHPQPTGVRDVITDAIADFGRLPSMETLTILSIGGVGAAIGHGFDRPVTRTFAASEGLGTVLSSGETLGGARAQLAGALATYSVGRITGSSKVTTVGADLIRAQIVTQALTAGIKLSVGRDRPDQTQYSFPSGHASVSFATATVLQRNFGWKAGLPAYGFASYVAASRVQSKRHFLSDVAFGAAIGIAAGRTVTLGRGDARFALSPAFVPGGAGVNLTLLQKH